MCYDPMQFFAPLHHFTLCKTPVTGGLLPVTEASKGRISISFILRKRVTLQSSKEGVPVTDCNHSMNRKNKVYT